MQRRKLLQMLFGVAAVGNGQESFTPRLQSKRPSRLPRVQVSADRIIGELVCLRSNRAAGFVFRPEVMD
jgi:hypothetical protein